MTLSATPSFKKGQIVRNAARCRKCGGEIESKHRHDFVTCRCGAISVDGGKDYLRRLGTYTDVIELSQVAHECSVCRGVHPYNKPDGEPWHPCE